MDRQKIIGLLKDYNPQDVEKFVNYILKLEADPKCSYVKKYNETQIANMFKEVAEDGLVFDGQHITLQSRGMSFDYIAYKNKMLLAYPESLMDIQLVYKGDEFTVGKESGSVNYSHKIGDPFGKKDADVIGGYCVIKNKRGETLTLLSKDDIEKHRKVASTDMFWQKWYPEMCLKTLAKKGCKFHCADLFEKIDAKDNENYNVENPLDLEIDLKAKVDACTNVDELKIFYHEYKGKVTNPEPFNKYVSIKKQELSKI